jgi:ribosomal protein S27E
MPWAELTIRVFIDEDALCPECGEILDIVVDDIVITVPCHSCGSELLLESDDTGDTVH